MVHIYCEGNDYIYNLLIGTFVHQQWYCEPEASDLRPFTLHRGDTQRNFLLNTNN